ncbi:MAG: phospholipase A [Desulfobulbaceae bacterium]|jgi:phospholipase A1|nr:phospholipase A [Desulfobulbaceae bacterium]
MDNLFIRRRALLACLCLLVSSLSAFAEQMREAQAAPQEFAACVRRLALEAADVTTIGEIRARCRLGEDRNNPPALSQTLAVDDGAFGKKLVIDQENLRKPFTLMAHRANYFLLAAHNFHGWSGEEFAADRQYDLTDLKRTEAQFQISGKMPLAVDLFDLPLDIYAGYTMRSFWQVYDTEHSSPFRETDHEPEAWLQLRPGWRFLGWTNSLNSVGVNHQSNGQAGNLSRSWNRAVAGAVLERGDFSVMPRGWFRIQEDAENDDNPKITEYLGHGDLTLGWRRGDHTFTLMLRNNLESGFSEGAMQLAWSFPLFSFPHFRGYIQYFGGYGESLIDYDRYVNRLGVGISLTDLL